ncbi:hypothetical protein [Thermus tengchongensis]|uniref:hypothetical protein n=1 Tax=Thermus tengchongensis TaxID=1214928 RepID=UPI001F37396A|nr:hypothetical protein [Thermus tengchongensis]
MSKLWKPDNAGKVIPVVRVRPLLPPPPQAGVRLQPQHMHWQLGRYVEDLSFGPGGRGRRKRWVVDMEAEQHNIVLDNAYDTLIAQHGFIFLSRYAVVGTGSVPPSPTQTGLANEIARTQLDQNGSSNTRTITRPADGVYDINVAREFTETQVGNMNLTEWGFSPSGTSGENLMSRELFRDGNGTPIVITPDSDQRLRLIYTIRITISPLTAPASINIDGIGVRTGTFYVNGGGTGSIGTTNMTDLLLVDALVAGSTTVKFVSSGQYVHLFAGNFQVNALYSGTPTYVDSDPNRYVAISYQSYVPGSRQRLTNALTFGTTQANETIRSIALGIRNPNYWQRYYIGINFDSGQEFTKTNLYKLTIGEWTLTWGP